MNKQDIDWTQAPADATHAGFNSADDLFFYKNIGAVYYSVFASGRWHSHPGGPIAEELIPRPSPPRTTEQILNSWMIEIATLTGVLYGWMESDGYKPIYEYIAESTAGQDAQRGGCLRLSIAVFRILDRIVDWEAWEHGVFSYEHLEDICHNIPYVLTEQLTRDDWAELAANYVIPADLEQWLADYVRSSDDLRLLHDPDREASIALFQAEMDVPRAIAERAYKMGWRKLA